MHDTKSQASTVGTTSTGSIKEEENGSKPPISSILDLY